MRNLSDIEVNIVSGGKSRPKTTPKTPAPPKDTTKDKIIDAGIQKAVSDVIDKVEEAASEAWTTIKGWFAENGGSVELDSYAGDNYEPEAVYA